MAITLLDKARSSLRGAVNFASTGDEADFSWSAFHIQQAVEMAMKYALELCGVDYAEIHSIPKLARCFPESQDFVPEHILEELEAERGIALSTWEASSRYDNSFLTSKRLLDRNIDFAEMLIECVADGETRYRTQQLKNMLSQNPPRCPDIDKLGL